MRRSLGRDLRWSVAVHECRETDYRCPRNEQRVKLGLGVGVLKYVRGGDAGHNDGTRGGEALEDVVSVLHHHRDNQSSHGLEEDDGPDDGVVSLEEAVSEDAVEVLAHACDGGDEEADQRHLDVAHPNRGGGALHHPLEVHAREAAGAAAAKDAEYAQKTALLTGEVDLLLLREVHDGDSDGQGHDGGPLHGGWVSTEHQHGEYSGGDDLHLGQHLKEGRREVRRGDILEVVLDDIQTRGHGQTEEVSPAVHELVPSRVRELTQCMTAVSPQTDEHS